MMARKRDPDRITQLLDCAALVFMKRGYKQTKMSDVAKEASVAPGTLYLYFEGKEALFYVVMQRALLAEAFSMPGEFPISTLSQDAILGFIREEFLKKREELDLLNKAIETEGIVDPKQELNDIINELYTVISHMRVAIRLIERSALEWPALFSLHFRENRRHIVEKLSTYLEKRIHEGYFRPVPHIPTAARAIVENIAWFAMHRHYSPDSEMITDSRAKEVVLHLLTYAIVKEQTL